MVDRPTASEDPLGDRTVLVIGANSGIGTAATCVPTGDGADVYLATCRVEQLEPLVDEVRDVMDATTSVAPTNVTDSDAVWALVDATVERFGSFDIVVCNAGLSIDKPVAEPADEEYRLITGVDINGMFRTARETLPHLEASEGNLVFLGSISGGHPRPYNPVYAVTKWWVRRFASSLQGSIGGENVGMTCVSPTEVRTELGFEGSETLEASFEEGEVMGAIEVTDAIAYAVH